jgi:hypothetical protein
MSRVNIPALIDQLVNVADGDFGYSPSVTGQKFLPLQSKGQIGVMLLYQEPTVPSVAMRELVKQGAAAVPHLVAHLGDQRPTRLVIKPFVGLPITVKERADYNHRIT